MNKSAPLVSIITPSYNSAAFIAQTIESILNQQYQNWELLITDDCSTDETPAIAKSFAEKDSRVNFFKLNENQGAGVARNHSIRKASGKFIAFCDSDDQWMPDKLEKQVAFMLKKDIALSFSSYKVIDEKGNPQGNVIAKSSVDYNTMLKNNYIGCLTAMYDAEKLGKMYMPKVRKRQDWGLWLSILKKVDRAWSLPELLSIYRVRNESISSNKLTLMQHNYKLYREVEGFSPVKSAFFTVRFLYYYLLKKIFS